MFLTLAVTLILSEEEVIWFSDGEVNPTSGAGLTASARIIKSNNYQIFSGRCLVCSLYPDTVFSITQIDVRCKDFCGHIVSEDIVRKSVLVKAYVVRSAHIINCSPYGMGVGNSMVRIGGRVGNIHRRAG